MGKEWEKPGEIIADAPGSVTLQVGAARIG